MFNKAELFGRKIDISKRCRSPEGNLLASLCKDVDFSMDWGKILSTAFITIWQVQEICWKPSGSGDYAQDHGIAMAMHQAGSPISFMANVHCAAATENFLALEHHGIDYPYWEDLVTMTGGGKIIEKGYAPVPLTAPGLGIELNEDVVRAHLNSKDKSFFAPTDEWNEPRSHNRTYS